MMAYVFEAGSNFEIALNTYMSGFKAIQPKDILGRAVANNLTNTPNQRFEETLDKSSNIFKEE